MGKLKILLLQTKADGDVQKDEEQKQKGGGSPIPSISPDPCYPNIPAAPLPPNLPADLSLCGPVAGSVKLAPSQAGVSNFIIEPCRI